MRRGNNRRLVRALCRGAKARVRVGGGIRSPARAQQILRWGAEKVIVGSAAFRRGEIDHAFLRRLVERIGRRRVILALDTEGGRIVVRSEEHTSELQSPMYL